MVQAGDYTREFCVICVVLAFGFSELPAKVSYRSGDAILDLCEYCPHSSSNWWVVMFLAYRCIDMELKRKTEIGKGDGGT